MPKDFGQLVAEVEERNKRNREAAWNQISPYLGAIIQKANYEQQKQKESREAAEGYSQLGKQMGVEFNPLTLSSGKYASPEMQGTAFNAAATKAQPLKMYEAYASLYGWEDDPKVKSMTPGQLTVFTAKKRDDQVILDSINTTFAAYPEIAQKYMNDPKFNAATPTQKAAMINRQEAETAAAQKLQSDIAEEQRKSQQKVSEYWQTTGAMQQQQLNWQKEKSTLPGKESESSQVAANTIKTLEKEGMAFGAHTVRAYIGKDNNLRARVYIVKNGKQQIVEKTKTGIYVKDGKDWVKLKPKTNDNGSIKEYRASVGGSNIFSNDIISALNKGYEAYEKAKLKLGTVAASGDNDDLDYSQNDLYFEDL